MRANIDFDERSPTERRWVPCPARSGASRSLRCVVAALAWLLEVAALAETPYQKPPKNVLDVLHAPLPPSAVVNPTHDTLILATPVRYPPIAVLAQPMLRLGGVRIVPKNHGVHGAPYWSEYVLTKVADGSQQKVALPAGARVSLPRWSADGKRYAFTNVTADAVELWVGEATSPKVRRISGVHLNPVLDDEVHWMPDQKTLLVKLVPKELGPAPADHAVPEGPAIQEASGEKGASSTYELRDTLKNPHDADLFDYYGTSQLALVDYASGKVTPIGKPAMYTDLSPSPDGQHVLVESMRRPYSYITTYERFPHDVVVWDRGGKLLHKMASLPLTDRVPIWGVPTGPRDFMWRPTEPATLVWAEALDGGDWKTEVPNRDRLLTVKAPFDAEAVEIGRTGQRFAGLWWGEKGGFAFVNDVDLIKHRTRTFALNVDDPKVEWRLVWDRSTDERYKHPGYPVFRTLPNGFHVLEQDGDSIYLSGAGASPEGDRPFLDKFNIQSLKAERLFRSAKDSYETFAAWFNASAGQFITRRETPSDHPDFYVRTLGAAVLDAAAGEPARASTPRAITKTADPTPEVRGITKKLVKYKRADGVDLSFTLYLPPGYKEGTRLPTVVWAYPLDYADPQMAGQVAGSTQRFTILGWPLHLFFLLDGYAVIDNPSLPVVGDANKIYDTYMEQLVAGAKAAVDKAVDLGVTDPERIGVMGHSHGGLMTVNLLAHSDLFRAGIARSGAYNRSLTAFGFQNERRTLWEAPDVYIRVSPLFSADKIKSPLLLIHGEDDYNPGTVPLQSEKLYEAIRGNGGTVRLVMLPFESHGYQAMESTEHVLWEMLNWFDRYVKEAKPRAHIPSWLEQSSAKPEKKTVTN
jgi:dipeptidyl aminopeptidase/acylaminoacyl peptidase